MRLLQDGWKIVIEQKALVAAFAALASGIALAEGLADLLVEAAFGADGGGMPRNFVETVAGIAGAAGYAALYAVFFARLGKEIDKPLWKCKDDREALRRFFVPWFILTLALRVLYQVQLITAKNFQVDASITLQILFMGIFVFAVPLGACIMYWGRLNLDEIPEALTPIPRQFMNVALVLLIGVIQFFAGSIVYPSLLPEWALDQPLAHVPVTLLLGVLDCWAFSVMWLILMIHRDTDYGDDFEF